MEPQIEYARTEDGVSIAYSTVGDGPPVLFCPGHILSMQSIWSDPAPGSFCRELAARTRLTIFDSAGIGASQRDVSDVSLAAQVRAIEAVAARLADGPFTLVAADTGSASAVLYAIRHHGRVRKLACANPAPGWVTPQFAAAIRQDWSLARRRFAGVIFPEGPVSQQRWYSKAMRESMTAEVAAAYIDEVGSADPREIYRRIPVPTLFCVGQTGPGREAALALASLVPDCRVAVVSADRKPAAAILEFMGLDAARGNTSPVPSGDARGTAIILFADVVDSAPLTERIGDAAFRDASRALDDGIRSAMRDAGGNPVEGKVLGDGVMGVFASAAQAIAAARGCVSAAEAAKLQLHIGVHAGDVIHEKDNVYGGAVNIASRICGLCEPGAILVSQTVRDLARTSAGVAFEDRGEHALKGIADPVRVFVVRAS